MNSSSPSHTVLLLVIGVAFAVIAYFAAERFKKQNGVTPWSWPSMVWAIIGFVSFLVWAILFAIASRNTKKKIALTQTPWGQPNQANWYPAQTAPPNFGQTAPPSQGQAQAANPYHNPGFWSADPTGRYTSRYWDGTRWTDYVSNGTTTEIDPLVPAG